ncbi:MAG: hypothetical protein K6E68_00405 [Lachnospiraceae bacterium]|nr:hypothetical protein [Lachnospiraceae bacterium]
MRRAKVEDAAAIDKMTVECFGDSYLSVKEITDYILDDWNRLYVEEDEKGLAGAILFLREDKSLFLEDMEIDSDDYDRLSRGKAVLHHKFSVIRQDLRGSGMMTRMLNDALKEAEDDGKYGVLFTQGWIQPDGTVPMEGIFDRAGYVKYKRQKSPWYKPKFFDKTCVLCGGRCKCDAMVYYREL